MRERRHFDVRPRSPPPRPATARDREVQEQWRFPSSYRTSGPVRNEPYRSSPLGSDSWKGERYRDVRTGSSSKPREEIGGNRSFSGSNRSGNEIGSGQRREQDGMRCTNEERDGNLKKLSQFCESLSRRESTSKKFEWDNLLTDHKPTGANANTDLGSSPFNGYCNKLMQFKNGKTLGLHHRHGVSDMGVAPTSKGGSRTPFGCSKEPTTRSRNHHGVDCGNVSYVGNMRILSERTSIVDPIVDMIEENDGAFNGSVKERQSFDNHGCFGEGYVSVRSRESHLVEMDGEDDKRLGCRSNCVDYGMEVCLDAENVKLVEDCGFERGSGSGSCGDGFKTLPISYEGLYVTQRSPHEFAMAEELSINDPLEMMLKRQHSLDMETTRNYRKCLLSYNWEAFNEMDDMGYGDRQWTNQDMKQLSLLSNSGLRYSASGMAGGMLDRMTGHGSTHPYNQSSSPDFALHKRSHSSKSGKPSKRNIKQRLGPAQNVKKRLAPARDVKKRMAPAPSARNMKKRLGPAPSARKVTKKLPLVKAYQESCLQDPDGSLPVKGVKSSESNLDKKKHAKSEPPEDSEEFAQLVQRAFLKFIKLLNENSANRRKYMEHGRTATLKCGVCGRNSKEFEDTLSLVQHALLSCKVGLRSEHLGLHKALCVLMGWNSAEFPNNAWVRQILPDAEASLQKEDLIIWPPVVVVHNCSITNDNPNKRMIVSIERLKGILRAMGFGQGMTNLCRGKAANQSIIVVNFHGTFSGLREAERLHRLYSENKHGRAEFCQISYSGSDCSSGQTQRFPANNIEGVLYGYLGIAGDLDKLDFETKKRSVVKSKKEIEAIADASLNDE